MSNGLTLQDFEHLADACHVRMQASAVGDTTNVACGTVASHLAGSGLTIVTARVQLAAGVRMASELPRGIFAWIVTKGVVRIDGAGRKECEPLADGSGVLAAISNPTDLTSEIVRDGEVEGLSVVIDETWLDCLGSDDDANSEGLCRLHEFLNSSSRQQISPAPEVSFLANEIIRPAPIGLLGQLHRESRTLDLLGRILEPIIAPKHQCPMTLRRADIDLMEHAREILLSRLMSPPPLSVLAGELGINVSKVKTHFRIVFGESVFEFVRNRQMNFARQLLESGHSNVSQTAYMIGYNNPANFTTAFRRHFGVTPGTCLRR